MSMPASVRLVLVAVAGLTLAGCGSDSTDRAPSTTTERTATTTTPVPSIAQITIRCENDSADRWIIEAGGSYQPIWAAAPKSCEATRNTAALTPLEEQAIAAAGYPDPSSLRFLYGQCAEVDPGNPYVSPTHSLSPDQIKEVTGMLTLCPGHPYAGQLNEAIGRSQADAAAEASGELFHAGTFKVGEDIQPGTYAVEGDITDCYWERTDANGGIIDNGFAAGARRVEVTIAPGDYSFHNEHCGEWRKVS